jgi:hypothetical protein
MNCPSDLKLEGYLMNAALSEAAPHVAVCERCRARLRQMEREGEDFRRFVYPATIGALQGRPPLRWLGLSAPAAALAAAAAVVLMARSGPPDDYSGTKGAALKLTVYAGSSAGARALDDREAVPASASLRFRVQPSAPCRLAIVSVDDGGQVSRLFPAAGEVGVNVAQPQALPGGAVLDGRAGLERIYAVCTPAPLPLSLLEEAVRAAAPARGAGSIRTAGPLRGLPQGSAQTTLLLEKLP